VVRIGGRRVDGALPGRHGRALLGYLVLHRDRGVDRDELVEALWPGGAPAAPHASLRPLVSRLRSALGPGVLVGRGELRLALPPGAWVDVDAADDAVHRAEPAVARGAWHEGWAPAHIALNVSQIGRAHV
jgi:DNA-binding SARP family transcriptional activator